MAATSTHYDAVVIGAGPNGLAAAIEIARAGRSVAVFEAASTVGGGCRSAELTEPGITHDVCSAIHPLALASPFMRTVPMKDVGVEFAHPEVPFAHPLDGRRAGALYRSVEETAANLGDDAKAYTRLMKPLVESGHELSDELLGPLHVPRRPLTLARFALRGAFPATMLAKRLKTDEGRGLIAGVAAHSMLPLSWPPTGGFGLMLALLGHLVGWPAIKGGSQRLSDGLARHLNDLGGEIVLDSPVTAIGDLPTARAYLFDTSPRAMVEIAGDRLPHSYKKRIERFRLGAGVVKVDYALNAPVPWANDACRGAGTVHVGGSIEQITASERAVFKGGHPDDPFVLVAQQSVFDDTRAPAGRHALWAYCHVPNGSDIDMSDRIESQIERFAPGFRDTIVARGVMTASDMEDHNANYIGGDINGGRQSLWQQFVRPTKPIRPYSTPADDIYICSASTPPGGGVHGMCGYLAARLALKRTP
ncbi:MAG: phytoene desaturase family protein [Actinomycetota bacterium]